MVKNENVLTGYCFLAALTENQNDLFKNVYVPICKRALSQYSLAVSEHGTASDIKELILEEYGINVPIVLIRKLIRAVNTEFSRKEKAKHNFQIMSNGDAFQIHKYTFVDLENTYKKQKRNALALQMAFEEYVKSEVIV